MKRLLWTITPLALAIPLLAVQTQVWQVATFRDFLRGHLSGVSISQDGSLTLAPESDTVFNPNQALALSMASGPDGVIYLGTGHEGKVFRIGADGKGSLFFTAHEPDIFALAVGPDGDLYAGSSPEGKIYRITPGGQSSVFYDPGAKYIWALAFDSQGRLYAGTGDQGKIFQIDSSGRGRVFFESHQTHIMCLAFDHQGNLLAGSSPNGLVYRITPSGKGFVLYQAGLSEIHALAVGPKDQIYAAALSGPMMGVIPQMLGQPVNPAAIRTQVMTVMAAAGSELAATTHRTPGAQRPAPQKPMPPPSFNRPAPEGASAAHAFAPSHGQGALFVINPDSTVNTLWRSDKESIFGLAVRGPDLLFSTSGLGRIYNLLPSDDGGTLTLLTETHEALATRLLLDRQGLYIATSNVAKLIRLGPAEAVKGTYKSNIEDAKFISHWGELTWRDQTPSGASIEFYTRSGNFGQPDNTWSDWTGPYTNADGSTVKSPPARYIQWKAVLRGTATARPTLDEVSLAYLNENIAPEIHSLTVSTSEERDSASSPPEQSPVNPAITFGNPSVVGPISFGAPAVAPQNQEPLKVPVTLTWQASDPDGDPLTYNLYAKSTDEHAWHLLKAHMRVAQYTIAPHSLPDGQYEAKLIASDGDANPPQLTRRAEMISAPFWIDNTPPEITVLSQKVQNDGAVVRFEADDPVSPLHSAEISTDGNRWHDVLSDSGIVDAQSETFTVKLQHLKPGEHVVALRAYDTSGNVGMGKAVIEIPASVAAH